MKVMPLIALLACLPCAPLPAEEQPEVLFGPPSTEMTNQEAQGVGMALCGKTLASQDNQGLSCGRCPPFTSDAGEVGPLLINNLIRLPAPSGEGPRFLVDTLGCEPHFKVFGGASLLIGPPRGTVGSWQRAFYQPGVRLDDCLLLEGIPVSGLLICNESETAQGEVVGRISVMEVTHLGVTRWPLLRWYDNSGAGGREIARIVPMSGHFQDKVLRIRLHVLETELPEPYDSLDDAIDGGYQLPKGSDISLSFQLRGARFFGTPATQKALARTSAIIRQHLN